ncbi:MAG: DUF4867 family protein [Lachnospiraceae bacterium]|nr:DUF4867 family protein [Lachnospiraceae bacterium]
MLDHLNEVNDVEIHSVFEPEFQSFGRVITGYDVSSLCDYLKDHTDIPDQGNIYVASVPEMEKINIADRIQNEIYGGMPIQIGYCNGKNSTYNGFEYHKGSEINIAVTGFMMVLGHTWLIAPDGTYRTRDATVFFVPENTVIEMYQTTLHLSPCKVCDEGFKGVVVLPRGTNTPLEHQPVNREGENKLLLQTNKWVIAHPEREPLIKQGAFPGLLGENKELKY